MQLLAAGKKLQIINNQTGEIVPVEVFVAILSHSQYTYVQACVNQKREEWYPVVPAPYAFVGAGVIQRPAGWHLWKKRL